MLNMEGLSRFIAILETLVLGAKCGDIESREMLISYRDVLEREGYNREESWEGIWSLVDQCIQDTADNPLA